MEQISCRLRYCKGIIAVSSPSKVSCSKKMKKKKRRKNNIRKGGRNMNTGRASNPFFIELVGSITSIYILKGKLRLDNLMPINL